MTRNAVVPRRFLAGMMTYILLFAPFSPFKTTAGETKEKEIKKITVGEGKYETIEEARDYIRTLDKTKYSGIEVTVSSGTYIVADPITFTEEDAGLETCPISYIGEDGATIVGGVALTAKDFTVAEGRLTEYFPEEVRDKIVSVDLKNYGFTAEMIEKAMESGSYLNTIPFLSLNGSRQILAQYPNDWLHVGDTVTHSADGTTDTAIDGVTLQTVEYGEEYAADVQSWSEVLPIYVRGRLFKLWCPDDTRVAEIYKDEAKVDIYFGGGHEPQAGGIMYFYNVPEALDIPGEYIIDSDATLYYYPTEEFGSAILTLPLAEGIMAGEGMDYYTIKNITFTSSNGTALELSGKHITIDGCTISSAKNFALKLKSEGATVINNTMYDIGAACMRVESGDVATMTGDPCLVSENDFYNYSVTDAYGNAISACGVNITISHNDCHDANTCGIATWDSVNTVVEYNHLWNLSQLCEDMGMLSGGGRENYNVVYRYNYVHDIMPTGAAARILEVNPDFHYYGTFGLYNDNGTSYVEAYGNIIANVDNGYLSNGGRGNTFKNNLLIDCHMWYIWYSNYMRSVNTDADGNLHGTEKVEEFVYSDLWKEKNPDLAAMKLNAEETDKDDTMLWLNPAGNVCENNVIYYNKAKRSFSNWGVRPYNIEEYVVQFSSEGISTQNNEVLNGITHVYSSARQQINMEEIIKENSELLGITYEEFLTIGRTK